jgi:hypothetical protein
MLVETPKSFIIFVNFAIAALPKFIILLISSWI